jgi:uncharacterized SAM-binding protein YcdF (DUF218 family)
VSDAVSFVFSAGGILVCVLAFAIAQLRRPASPRPRLALLAISVLYLLASIPAVATLASRVLLVGREPLSSSDVPSSGRTALVVLGSGGLTARDWNGNAYSIVDPWAAARVLEASRIFHATDPAWVISSGGRVYPDDPAVPSGESMRDALVQLGVPRDRVVVETQSRTTHEEAVIIAPMLRSLAVDHVVLVTSDTHMLRSLCTFRAAGIDSIAAIARNPHADAPSRTRFSPGDRGLQAFGGIAHEILGIAYYSVRGWCRIQAGH